MPWTGHEVEVDGLLFDLDGVLIDSRAVTERIWRGWAEQHDIDGEALVASAHGRRTEELIREHEPHLDASMEAEQIERDATQNAGEVGALPGAERLLSWLAARAADRCAIVTSATQALARARLVAAGLWIPPLLLASEDVQAGKPSPEGYRLAADLLGIDPGQALVFEDAPDGVRAGLAAGSPVVGIAANGDPPHDPNALVGVVTDLGHVHASTGTRDRRRGLRIELSQQS